MSLFKDTVYSRSAVMYHFYISLLSLCAIELPTPCHPAAGWSPPALLAALWSCCWADPAETAASCSLTGAARSCCSASRWSPVTQPRAPCCLVHRAGGRPSGWWSRPLPRGETWSPVYHCGRKELLAKALIKTETHIKWMNEWMNFLSCVCGMKIVGQTSNYT